MGAVAVDPDGAVTLRGNTNVTILVDGKPSAMLQGDNRGAALNAMASDDIESIEVINNPGAQFGNEGGGGPILNLVMRRNKRPAAWASSTPTPARRGAITPRRPAPTTKACSATRAASISATMGAIRAARSRARASILSAAPARAAGRVRHRKA